MKKIILILSILLSGIYLANFIGAITVTKNSGEVLDNTTWTNISSLTEKIDISGSDIKLNGKLYITGELCSDIGGVKKCLGGADGKNCNDIYNKGITTDGYYKIKPDAHTGSAFQTYCDMRADGGRTMIHRGIGDWTEVDFNKCMADGFVDNANLYCIKLDILTFSKALKQESFGNTSTEVIRDGCYYAASDHPRIMMNGGSPYNTTEYRIVQKHRGSRHNGNGSHDGHYDTWFVK
ncbi:MAG: fibrinogen-like YCDxxxxGGGW domain-containing protein [Candidatus Gracilibacteria bacterium]|nr:fibrinogen-like YCDxxxxGGGW domain-containing protein [Candidatus Gracilibacteria bacterium]